MHVDISKNNSGNKIEKYDIIYLKAEKFIVSSTDGIIEFTQGNELSE